MRVGFTGTQKGMTSEQIDAVGKRLLDLKKVNPIYSFLHGDCIGADEQALTIATSLGYYTVAYPPLSEKKKTVLHSDRRNHPKPYLERNKNIAVGCDRLIAAPAQHGEVLRSGTWATVRYARQVGRIIYIVYPNGREEIETWEGGSSS